MRHRIKFFSLLWVFGLGMGTSHAQSKAWHWIKIYPKLKYEEIYRRCDLSTTFTEISLRLQFDENQQILSASLVRHLTSKPLEELPLPQDYLPLLEVDTSQEGPVSIKRIPFNQSMLRFLVSKYQSPFSGSCLASSQIVPKLQWPLFFEFRNPGQVISSRAEKLSSNSVSFEGTIENAPAARNRFEAKLYLLQNLY